MTREEAIRIANVELSYAAGSEFINLFARLGMLRFDEPKSGSWEKFLVTFAALEYDDDENDDETIVYDIKRALKDANLKIVEK